MKTYLVVAIALFSCTEKKSQDKNENNQAQNAGSVGGQGFLTVNDFSPTYKLKDISVDELSGKINNESSFYSHSPKSPNDSDSDNCTKNSFLKLSYSTTKTRLIVSGDLDFSTCFKPDPSTAILKYSVKLYYFLECLSATVDLSQYNGKPVDLTQLKNVNSFCKSPAGSVNSQLINVMQTIQTKSASFTSNSAPTAQQTIETVYLEATINSQSGPCTIKINADQTTQAQDCTDFSVDLPLKDIASGQLQPYGNSRKITLSNLIADATSPYYAGSSAPFILNDWAGVMNYTTLANPPTWTATNKTTGQKSSGLLTKSLSLVGDSNPGNNFPRRNFFQ